MPRSDSQKTAAAVDPDMRYRGSGRPGAGTRPFLFIVASPRPQVGKTFVARLLCDFLRLDGGDPLAFDLNPSGNALRDYLPAIASDIGDTRGQMELFDCLIVDDGTAKVVDVGYASFDLFFAITQQIRFFEAAQHRSIESTILFAADLHPLAVRAYGDLQRQVRGAAVVPVFNEAIAQARRLRQEFPFARAATVPLQIPQLAPMLKAQIDNSSYSFADFHDRLPKAIPAALAFELRSWTRRTFVEFRELELRLLLEKLRASLPGVEL